MKTAPKILVVLLMLAFLFTVSSSVMADPDGIKIKIHPNATIDPLGEGLFLFVNLKISCEPYGPVVETWVTANQDNVGNGFNGDVVCDGKQHEYVVRVRAFGGPYHPGNADVVAYVNVCPQDDWENCVTDQASRTVHVRE